MDDPFATLGVPRRFDLPRKEVEQRHRDLSRALHPDRYVNAAPAERRVALERAVAVNDAWRALRDPLARATALLRLNGVTIEDGDRAPAALLMDIMELREALDDAKGHPERVAPLRARVQSRVDAAHALLAEVFSTDPPAPDALPRARDAVVSLKYLGRFLEEADASEDTDGTP